MTGDVDFRARVRELFGNAIELPQAERRDFVAKSCGVDEALRREVEDLLRSLDDAGTYLDDPTVAAPSAEMAGDVLGRYRLVEPIGEGGFGAVYRAEQLEPVRRDVALKIIKLGMDTRQVVARFEMERQTLASMDHPSIARVLDAGATPSGRPYFVMELVSGEPITSYCDRHSLPIPDRLALFAQVCLAVQHAHQKGVIHRDLKPSNILVSTIDGRPWPKVIDFGIAKAVSPRTAGELVTDCGLMVGTPEFMSPEQAGALEGGGAGVDTRTDIYSLGVLLYQLLTGTLPFQLASAEGRDPNELRRQIRECDPPKPSTRLRLMKAAGASAARARLADGRGLVRRLRNDLDWITLKAMSKERARRYASASELAEDLQRHLKGEPVTARPPSIRYLVGKFVRRRRGPVTAACVVLLVLIGGVIATGLALLEARRQRDSASWQAYSSGLAAAAAAMDASDFASARTHLEAAPRHLRGWEWRHLATRSDRAAFSFRAEDAPVRSIAVSPDGERVVTATDRWFATWDARTGQLLRRHSTQGRVHSVALDDSGLRILAVESVTTDAQPRRAVVLRDAETGAVRWRFDGARSGPDAFSANGDTVAIYLEAERAFAWVDADSGEIVRTLPTSDGAVQAVAMSSEGEILYATWNGDLEGTAGIVTPRGDVLRADRISIYLDPVFASGAAMVAWNGWTDGRVAAKGLRDMASRMLPARPGRERRPLDITADGTAVALAEGHTIALWDPRASVVHATLPGHRAPVTSASFARDGLTLVSADQHGEVRVWTLPMHETPLLVPSWETWITSCGGSDAAGRTLFTGGWSFVRLWDARTGRHRLICNAGSRHIEVAAMSPDGSRIVATGRDRSIHVLDAETGEVLLGTPLRGATRLSFTPEGDAILRLHGGVITVIDPDDGTVRATLTSTWPIRRMALAASVMATLAWPESSEENDEQSDPFEQRPAALQLWDLKSLTVAREVALPNVRHSGITLDHLGERAALLESDGSVSVWQVATGMRMWRQVRTDARAERVAFSRDGSRLAVADAEKIELIDAASGARCLSLRHGTGNVRDLTFSEGDASLIVIGAQNPLAVFDGVPPDAPTASARSELFRARQICTPLFVSRLSSERVIAEVERRSDLTERERRAAIAYARDRGDHLAALASDAIFDLRRHNYDKAIIRYEAIQKHRPEVSAAWDGLVAFAWYRLGRLDDALAAVERALAWQRRKGDPEPGTLALHAMIEHSRGRTGQAEQAWHAAKERARASTPPTDEFLGPIWTEAEAAIE